MTITTSKINNMIGWRRKNNNVAFSLVQFLCEIDSGSYHNASALSTFLSPPYNMNDRIIAKHFTYCKVQFHCGSCCSFLNSPILFTTSVLVWITIRHLVFMRTGQKENTGQKERMGQKERTVIAMMIIQGKMHSSGRL